MRERAFSITFNSQDDDYINNAIEAIEAVLGLLPFEAIVTETGSTLDPDGAGKYSPGGEGLESRTTIPSPSPPILTQNKGSRNDEARQLPRASAEAARRGNRAADSTQRARRYGPA